MVKKRCRRTALCVLLVLISVAATFFFIPKRPFFWLSQNMVEKIEYRTAYNIGHSAPRYEKITAEDQQRVVDGLRKIKVTMPTTGKSISSYAGGNNPFRVTLKNGKSFCFTSGGDFCRIYIRNGEHAGVGDKEGYKPIVVIFWYAKDKDMEIEKGKLSLTEYSRKYGLLRIR